MSATKTPSQLAAGKFFVRVGQAGQGPQRCAYTMPLFSLAMILDTEGWLAEDAKHLTERNTKGKNE